MKKKLFAIFGPILTALIALGICASIEPKDSSKVLDKAASSMSQTVLTGQVLKNKILADREYVPFFGSSELNRFDLTHPSVLAEKYHRGYTPFLIGSAGTQSLTQYQIMSSATKEIGAKRKIVFIISPQWFTKGGVEPQYFNHWYSAVQTYSWLQQVSSQKTITKEDRYFANRILDFSVVKDSKRLSHYLSKIAKGEQLTTGEQQRVNSMYERLVREDRLLGHLGIESNLGKIAKYAKQLPEKYQYDEISRLANKYGKKGTSNNKLGIANGFFTTRLQGNVKRYRGTQKSFDYRYSKEYSDFELVLNRFADMKSDVLFVITPVNTKWSEVTGLSQPMMRQTAKKIQYQLKSQGFNNVVNFVDKGGDPYFMTDTIHIGWQGWLQLDRYVKPFLESPYKKTDYKINPYFYTTDWQNRDPETLK